MPSRGNLTITRGKGGIHSGYVLCYIFSNFIPLCIKILEKLRWGLTKKTETDLSLNLYLFVHMWIFVVFWLKVCF